MLITHEPSIRDWRLAATPAVDRDLLIESLAFGSLDRTDRIIATGHQPWLWHPGILAKYAAARHASHHLDAALLNVIVDQDVHDPLQLDLPHVESDTLTTRSIRLGPFREGVPVGCQPPANAADVLRVLDDARSKHQLDLHGLISAWSDLPDCRTLAEQVAIVLDRLMRPYAGSFASILAGSLMRLSASQELLKRMLHEARACVEHYNAAVLANPHAGIALLSAERERVELPLWHLNWLEPRQRVYADLSDSKPVFTLGSGELIEDVESFAPRALLLTAVMRGQLCDLFIHGRGGGVYEKITEQWWQNWTGQSLSPMAVVSADMRLKFDVPLTEHRDVIKAVWYEHHLPHNLDRELVLDGELVQRKRELLVKINDDRDRSRRAVMFRELHQINDKLAKQYPQALQIARQDVHRVRHWRANTLVAARRDWCFALYPADDLHALEQAFASELSASRR